MKTFALLALGALSVGCLPDSIAGVDLGPAGDVPELVSMAITSDPDEFHGWVIDLDSGRPCEVVLTPDPVLELATEYAADQWDEAIPMCSISVGPGGIPVYLTDDIQDGEGNHMPTAKAATLVNIWGPSFEHSRRWAIVDIQVRQDPDGGLAVSEASSRLMHELGHVLGTNWAQHDEEDTLMSSTGTGYSVTERAREAVIERLGQ